MKFVATKKVLQQIFAPLFFAAFWIRDPRSGIRDPGSEIRDPRSGIRDPGSEIRDPRSGIRDPGTLIRDPRSGIQDPRSGMDKTGSGIRDKHPGSATLAQSIGKNLFRIPDPGVKKAPDPQHWRISLTFFLKFPKKLLLNSHKKPGSGSGSVIRKMLYSDPH